MSAVWWGNCLGCGRGPRTIYQYLAVEQTLFSCELGRYTAFGIAAQSGYRMVGGRLHLSQIFAPIPNRHSAWRSCAHRGSWNPSI